MPPTCGATSTPCSGRDSVYGLRRLRNEAFDHVGLHKELEIAKPAGQPNEQQENDQKKEGALHGTGSDGNSRARAQVCGSASGKPRLLSRRG
jgi:hypothetical protein